MVTLTKNRLQKLYEIDDYLWLQETLKLLKNNDFNSLDLENLIEELEDLGKNSFNKVRSLLRQIIIHLLLLEHWQEEYDLNHRYWMGEIIAFRDDLNNDLTTTLNNKLNRELEGIYNVSRRVVIQKTGLHQKLFPAHCPYSLEQLPNDSWYPTK
jgi:hypothetical protein